MGRPIGCRAELRRLAKYNGLITPQEMRTLRGQIRAGNIDAAWRGLNKIMARQAAKPPDISCCGGDRDGNDPRDQV